MAHHSFKDFELSFQSALHRSVILLVRYRTRVSIWSLRGNTRLSSCSTKKLYSAVHKRQAIGGKPQDGAVTQSRMAFQAISFGFPQQPSLHTFTLQHAKRQSDIAEHLWDGSCNQHSLFTRRYWGNHGCVAFLRRLICLSWAGHPTCRQVFAPPTGSVPFAKPCNQRR